MASFLGHHPLHTFLSSSNLPCSQKPKHFKCLLTYASANGTPARDRVIDFGKYKGRMLGTLPSTYLKWVSNNLRARDFEEWANLADQVLEDPVYNDRVEWEFAEKLLNGEVLATAYANAKSTTEVGAVAELLEISQRFGWDNEDKLGWSRVDFRLLGTSKGGRIPRAKEKEEKKRVENEQAGVRLVGEIIREKRVERRERLKMKKRGVILPNMNDKLNNMNSVGDNASAERVQPSSSGQTSEVYNPFPGRETLLRKALNRRSINNQHR